MSKRLNGPPGAPEALCPGTTITSINPTVAFLSVPHTGQPAGLLLQLVESKIEPNSTAKIRRGNTLESILFPPTIYSGDLNSSSGKTASRIYSVFGFTHSDVDSTQQTASI